MSAFKCGQDVIIIGPSWHPRLDEVGTLVAKKPHGWDVYFASVDSVGAGWTESNMSSCTCPWNANYYCKLCTEVLLNTQ